MPALNQAGARADCFHCQAAPEFIDAVDLESLAAGHQGPAYSHVAHPEHRRVALVDETAAESGIGEVFGDASNVIAKLRGRIRANVDSGDFGL